MYSGVHSIMEYSSLQMFGIGFSELKMAKTLIPDPFSWYGSSACGQLCFHSSVHPLILLCS